MGFNCGVVGLPNVGKSTIFNALTRGKAQSANYPFCTIDPNVGIVPVADPRIRKLAEMAKSAEIIMTTVEIVDIAGLVKGAAEGEGLGNQFLSHIANVDAILQVVRIFEDDDVTHVMGGVDPIRDVDIIQTELALKDMEILSRLKEKLTRNVRSGDKEAVAQDRFLDLMIQELNQGKPLRNLDLSDEGKKYAKTLNLLTFKPVLYVANVDENKIHEEPEALKKLKALAASENSSVVVISGKIEEEIAQLEEAERKEYLDSIGLQKSGLEQLVFCGYELLGLLTFFTVGPKETRAWTVNAGSKAPQAAGKIHTDFERGFIRAEVISYNDYIQFEGELGAKNNGRLRVEGKEYVVQDGDVVHFRFNV